MVCRCLPFRWMPLFGRLIFITGLFFVQNFTAHQGPNLLGMSFGRTGQAGGKLAQSNRVVFFSSAPGPGGIQPRDPPLTQKMGPWGGGQARDWKAPAPKGGICRRCGQLMRPIPRDDFVRPLCFRTPLFFSFGDGQMFWACHLDSPSMASSHLAQSNGVFPSAPGVGGSRRVANHSPRKWGPGGVRPETRQRPPPPGVPSLLGGGELFLKWHSSLTTLQHEACKSSKKIMRLFIAHELV